MEKSLTAKASIGIQKSVNTVFNAIINPEIMQHFFISKGSGKLVQNANVEWQFPEFDGKFSVSVKEIIQDKKIVLVWDPQSVVEINLEPKNENETVVKVTETGHKSNAEGISWAIQQTEGWANFLACMKAWLEYEIELRKGAFDFMKV